MSFVDEAGFIGNIWTTYMPLCAENDHVLICTSSPNVNGAAFSDIVRACDPQTGQPLVTSIVIGSPCDACLKTDKPWMCPHKSDSLAMWKNPKRTERLQKLYDECNVGYILRAELQGDMGSTAQPVFNLKTIGAIVEAYNEISRQLSMRSSMDEPLPQSIAMALEPPDVEAIIVALDPAGCGVNSEISVTAMGLRHAARPSFVVLMLGAERFTASRQHFEEFAVTVVQRLRSIEKYRKVPIVVAIEAMSNDCIFYATLMMQADKDIALQRVVAVMDIAKKLQVAKLGISVEPPRK